MTVAHTAAEALVDHVTLEVESIERLYLDLYQPTRPPPGGTACFFRGVSGMPVPASALMAPITGAFVAATETFARDQEAYFDRS